MKLFRGKKYKYITTRDIYFDDIRAVFFPKDFWEKYRYLGSVPYNSDDRYFKAILPLILVSDYEAKPWWCPRWFLRFLHLFGNDNSNVRVRNRYLHNLHKKITKGIFIWDWKTKWADNDLRLSVSGPDYIMDLADDIERSFYERNKPKEVDVLV